MPLDFGRLSMTELRTRPGEILDRVAERGEAFVIERDGQQRACLVPLSLFLPDIAPNRIAAELAELAQSGERPMTRITEARELALRLPPEPSQQAPFEITVVLPHGYPNKCPRVYAEPLESGTPHRWADGALCLFGVATAWNPGKHTVSSALDLARAWLQHYERWRKTGAWPKTENSNVE